jgi:hypothetical protein
MQSPVILPALKKRRACMDSARTPNAENNAAISDHVQHPSLNATNQSRDQARALAFPYEGARIFEVSLLQLYRIG